MQTILVVDQTEIAPDAVAADALPDTEDQTEVPSKAWRA